MADDLKSFRRSVSMLKKQGLLPKKIGRKKLDARKALPDWKVKGKKLSTIVRKYDDITSGKLTAVKVPPKDLRKYRKAGFETANNRVLIPHTKTETAKFAQGNIIVKPIKNKSGMERVQIPVPFQNLKQYLSDIRRDAPIIDHMKKRNEYFGIRFHGGQRANFYSSIESLLDDLQHYESIERTMKRIRAKQEEIYKNLEIVRITPSGALKLENTIAAKHRQMSKAYNRRHAKRVYERRKKKGPAVMNEYRRKQAEAAKEYRQRIKKNGGKQYAAVKRAAIQRRKKSNAKKKANKHRVKKTNRRTRS